MKAAVSKEDAKAVVRRAFEDFWSKGNAELAKELFTDDFVSHDPSTPDDFGKGPDRAKKLLQLYRGAFPDLNFEIEDIFAADDRVVTRWSSSGTHKNDFRGIAPTDKTARPTGITISRIENGRIAEEWINWDTLGLLRDLGLLS